VAVAQVVDEDRPTRLPAPLLAHEALRNHPWPGAARRPPKGPSPLPSHRAA
jgi:hypothetical protein